MRSRRRRSIEPSIPSRRPCDRLGYTPKRRGGYRCGQLALAGWFADNSPMATPRRTKRSLKKRPKYKQERRLKGRKMKAKKKAAHKRGLGRNKARRRTRGVK